MTAATATTLASFEQLPIARPTGYDGRSLATTYLVQEAGTGDLGEHARLVVKVTTSHHKHRKSYTTCLTRMRQTPAGHGSAFATEQFAPFSDIVHTHETPVARFGAKTLKEAHQAHLSALQEALPAKAAALFRPFEAEEAF